MAFTFSAQYTPEAEDRLRGFYQTLSEKDQRRFAALEAARLGFGGIKYIAAVLVPQLASNISSGGKALWFV